jgi:hypothetical protein
VPISAVGARRAGCAASRCPPQHRRRRRGRRP